MKLSNFIKTLLLAAFFSIAAINTAHAQSGSNFNTATTNNIGYTVMEDTLGGYWGVERVVSASGTVTTKYLNLQTNAYGTPTTKLYEVHKHPTTVLYDAAFVVLTNTSHTFSDAEITSISITAIDGTVKVDGASFTFGQQTLPLHATASISAPEASNGWRYALRKISITATSGTALVSYTR